MRDDGTWLEPAPVTPLTGDEPLPGTGSTVRNFWSFALSDLKTNIARGVLAEFFVARAVGAEESVRVSWDNFDVRTPDGIRIEVKSAAYLQGWRQAKLSTIRFSGLTGLAWDDSDGWGAEREVRADVFVFGIQTRKTHEDYDALDVAQWDWYVASASSVVEHGARRWAWTFSSAMPRARWATRRSTRQSGPRLFSATRGLDRRPPGEPRPAYEGGERGLRT